MRIARACSCACVCVCAVACLCAAACSTTTTLASSPAIAPSATPRLAATPTALDVDVAMLPDDAGRVGGISLRYCARPKTSWPRHLVPENRRALPFLVSAVDDNGRPLPTDGEGVVTRELGARCARIVVDAGRLADRIDDRDLAMRAGDDLMMSPDVWLWRPESFDDEARLFVRVDQSDDARFHALVPWTERDGDRLVVDAATFALGTTAAFGTFAVDELDAAGTHFVVARLDGGAAPPRFLAWLKTSADAVARVDGGYPFARVNVLVVPTHASMPIVTGFFMRGGGPTATFFVGDGGHDIDDDDLDGTGRWTITHELAHALLPPVDVADAWLNEGLATFHQDLLARRAGMLKDDETYWHELSLGLGMGAKRAAEDRVSLAEASTRMREIGTYQHAYWAGAALMLLAEIEARRSGASLDDFVRAARAMFRDDRPRSARAILDAVAAGSDAKAAAAARALLHAYDAHAREPFPSTEKALAALGVSFDSIGGVHLDDDARLASIRRAITRPTAAVAKAEDATGSTTTATALH